MGSRNRDATAVPATWHLCYKTGKLKLKRIGNQHGRKRSKDKIMWHIIR